MASTRRNVTLGARGLNGSVGRYGFIGHRPRLLAATVARDYGPVWPSVPATVARAPARHELPSSRIALFTLALLLPIAVPAQSQPPLSPTGLTQATSHKTPVPHGPQSSAAAVQAQSQQPSPLPPATRNQEPATAIAKVLRASTQNDPASHVPDVPLLVEFLEGRHTGPADEAVIGIEVTNQAKDGHKETRHASGLLLRCDGFFLLPPSLTSLAMAGGEAVKQSVRITLHPGRPSAERHPAYIRHYLVDGVDMAVMKAQDVHAPAARTLLPNTLKPGDEVELAWTEWNEASQQFGAVKRRKAKIGEPYPQITQIAQKESTNQEPGTRNQEPTTSYRPGEIPFAEAIEGVPGGATVVGPEGMAIGILPASAKRRERFVSFAQLARITNCVMAAPTTDAQFADLQKAAREAEEGNPDQPGAGNEASPAARDAQDPAGPIQNQKSQIKNDMVDIPGGPVRLPFAIQHDQRDMCGEAIACVPPFKIDRYKVSNREYYAFWKSIPAKERAKKEVRAALYPISWAESDPPFPQEIEDVPVLGVPLSGAKAFAQSKGKRLPTTYEWARAVFGVYGDAVLPAWVGEYMRDRQATWKRIAAEHEQYVARMIPDIIRQNALRQPDENLRGPLAAVDARALPHTIPFLDPREFLTAANLWSQSRMHAEVAGVAARWLNPLYVLPGGSRPFDTSAFGLVDVLLNGNEKAIFSPEPYFGEDPIAGRPQAIGMTMSTVSAQDVRSPVGQSVMQPLDIPRSLLLNGTDDAFTSPVLLSRRLVAGSSRVRAGLREFTPSDSEAYVEYRARLYEEMLLALPLVQARVLPIRYDTVASDAWGEKTVTLKPMDRPPNPRPGIAAARSLAGFMDVHTGAQNLVESPFTDRAKLGRRPVGGLGLTVEGRDMALPFEFGAWRTPLTMRFAEQYALRWSPEQSVRPDECIGLFLGNYFDETPYYAGWSGLSPRMTREMGRDWAKDPPVHVGDWPQLGASLTQPPDLFLVPNGFRCAR